MNQIEYKAKQTKARFSARCAAKHAVKHGLALPVNHMSLRMVALLNHIKRDAAKQLELARNATDALDGVTQRRGIDNQGFTFELRKYQNAGYRLHGSGTSADVDLSESAPVWNNAQVVAKRIETGKA